MRPLLGIARVACIAPCVLLLLSGCGSDSNFQASSNVAGNYTVSVTNADNGCMIENWEAGMSTSGIPFLIEQQDKNLNGTLQGVAGAGLFLWIGTNMFVGTATGNAFDITAHGSKMRTQGTCTYELNAEIQGSISGDLISGTIKYAPATSNDPACASLQCSSTQNFNGTRPPS
jgi:hypothetical protein